MLRLCCATARGSGTLLFRVNGGSRASGGGCKHMSTSSGGGGGGALKVVAGTVVLTTAGLGGVVGYCSVDPKFRGLVEETVPGSSEALELVLGPLEAEVPPPKPKPSKLKISSPVVVTTPKIEKKTDEYIASKVEKSTPVPAAAVETLPLPPLPALPPLPPVEAPPKVAKVVPAPQPVVESPPIVAKLPAEKEAVPVTVAEPVTRDIENSSLEVVLQELTKEMRCAVESAVSGHGASSEAVLDHINIMQKVLESNLTVRDDAAWNEMFEAAIAKSDSLKMAQIREREAAAAIDNVIESIAAGRKNRITSTNPSLLVAEEEANSAKTKLEQAKVACSAIQSEARVMEEYRDLVEAGRREFHQEMSSIMPDVKLGEKSGKLTDDELNMFITHAYRKVIFLQQQLAKQQTLEQERFKKALEKQRVETQVNATEKTGGELERQARELELEHERKMAVFKDEAEGELRAQLRRQAAAHSDHVHDVLEVQTAELNRKNDHAMEEKLAAADASHKAALAELSGTVTGLGLAVGARAAGDKAALKAQGLWMAVSSLENSVAVGRPAAANWDEKLVPLASEVSSVVGVAGMDDSFVTAIVGSLDPRVLERGVYTEDSLKERWGRVAKVAKKVARVGDQGGSLISYGLSYLQSVLLMDTSSRLPSEVEVDMDPSSLSATETLTLVSHSLDRGHLTRAVQYVNLLKGEPGRVARDWLEEARLTLETRQAVQALLAHAQAQAVAALP